MVLCAMLAGAWAAQLLHPQMALHVPGPPWSWVLTTTPAICALVAGLFWPDHVIVRAMGGGRLAIASLLAVALTCWPLAVYPVGIQAPAWLPSCGLGDPLASLPFAVALLAVVINLACSLGRRLRIGPDRLRYTILHAGMLIAVIGGAASHGGLVRARFSMEEGALPGDAATAEDGRRIHLPVALRLDDFVLERFAPMLVVAEANGQLVRGETLMGPAAEDHVQGLHVRVLEWVASAAVPAGTPVFFADPGASPAARVEVRDMAGAIVGTGWLHPGSPVGPPLFITLPDGRSLHLETPRPRRYLARVRVGSEPHEITVNNPLRVDGFAIYILSYDEAAGPASRTAVFEAVEDRALPVVYLGLALVLLGVLWHLWRPVTAGARP
jgi:hypothetical protein